MKRVLSALKQNEEEVVVVNGLRLIMWSVIVLLVFSLSLQSNHWMEWAILIPPVAIAVLAPILIYRNIEDAETSDIPPSETNGETGGEKT